MMKMDACMCDSHVAGSSRWLFLDVRAERAGLPAACKVGPDHVPGWKPTSARYTKLRYEGGKQGGRRVPGKPRPVCCQAGTVDLMKTCRQQLGNIMNIGCQDRGSVVTLDGDKRRLLRRIFQLAKDVYDGLYLHRIIICRMIQGGDGEPDLGGSDEEIKESLPATAWRTFNPHRGRHIIHGPSIKDSASSQSSYCT